MGLYRRTSREWAHFGKNFSLVGGTDRPVFNCEILSITHVDIRSIEASDKHSLNISENTRSDLKSIW